MIHASLFRLAATLEVAAALAEWAGALAFAVSLPVRRAPAWRHVAATVATVTVACATYASPLVAFGEDAVLSGDAERAPALAGLLFLSVAFGLAAGIPWGLLRRAGAAAAAPDVVADDRIGDDTGENVWTVARRTATRLFLPFAAAGLVIFAPRADGAATSTLGALLVAAMLLIPLGAVAVITVRHRGPILKLAGWSALAGIPLLTALFAWNGMSVADAFLFSAASAVVWAPIFGIAVWAVTGAREAGIRVTRTGLLTRSAPPAEPQAIEQRSPHRARRLRR
jgi:hypothetical protein